jgi:hypothetical protein
VARLERAGLEAESVRARREAAAVEVRLVPAGISGAIHQHADFPPGSRVNIKGDVHRSGKVVLDECSVHKRIGCVLTQRERIRRVGQWRLGRKGDIHRERLIHTPDSDAGDEPGAKGRRRLPIMLEHEPHVFACADVAVEEQLEDREAIRGGRRAGCAADVVAYQGEEAGRTVLKLRAVEPYPAREADPPLPAPRPTPGRRRATHPAPRRPHHAAPRQPGRAG